jgi:Leucine-rich repeat (LRR) protein
LSEVKIETSYSYLTALSTVYHSPVPTLIPTSTPSQAPRWGTAGVKALDLSSGIGDQDKLRRTWGLGTFQNLRRLDLSGNLIHTLEPEHVAPLTALVELNLARNKLRSLRGLEALAASLRVLDAAGNMIDRLR